MKTAMRSIVLGTALTLGVMSAPHAQVSIGIATPNISIGINVPTYPTMTVIPGYPVYYAPQVDANYFFYDGLYWVYANDNWYSSYWYNGPWTLVAPVYVPVYVLRVPVHYYRVAPVYFRGWRPDAAPRWGERWGHDWEQRRSGWDRWDRSAAPRAAPLPTYQRQYAGERYPQREQQVVLQDRNYHYQPRDNLVRERVEKERLQRAPAPQAHGVPPGQQRRDESRPVPAPSPQVNSQRGMQREPPEQARRESPPVHQPQGQRDVQQPQMQTQQPQQRGGPPQHAQGREDRKDAQRDLQREAPGQARREGPPSQAQRAPQSQPQSQAQPERQPQTQRGAPPQQHAQVRGPEQARVQQPDARGGGRSEAPAPAGNPGGNGKAQSQDRGGGNGKGGQDRGKGDDNGKK